MKAKIRSLLVLKRDKPPEMISFYNVPFIDKNLKELLYFTCLKFSYLYSTSYDQLSLGKISNRDRTQAQDSRIPPILIPEYV